VSDPTNTRQNWLKLLRPCPFCGGNPTIARKGLSEVVAYADEVAIQCTKCGARKSAVGDYSKPGYADNSTVQQRAIAAWNTRSGDSGMAVVKDSLTTEGWRPIEDAPRDGTEFQAWCVSAGDGWWEPRCKYNDEGNFFTWGRIDYDIDGWDFLCAPMRPTHWMPLPPPPTTAASQGGEK
jgi:Lar family restriction alleviation protein